MTLSSPQDSSKIWGYLTTFGWGLISAAAGQFGALPAVLWLAGANLDALVNPSNYDGMVITLLVLISNPISVGVLVAAIAIKRAIITDYLAVRWTPARYLGIGLAGIVVIIGATDLLLFLSGRAVVTPFQVQSYTSAAAEGWLLPMFIAAVIVAPAGEEITFRGFLFRGFARSERSAWPAIVVISALWAALHVQYDWTGILQIFVVGLFLGWMRWRSNSMLLTFVLHAAFNFEGTMETVLQVHFFPQP